MGGSKPFEFTILLIFSKMRQKETEARPDILSEVAGYAAARKPTREATDVFFDGD
jgi:hypothetical protein